MCAQKIGVLKIMRVKEDLIVNNKGGSQVVSGISAAAINPTLEFKSQNVPGYLGCTVVLELRTHMTPLAAAHWSTIANPQARIRWLREVDFIDTIFFPLLEATSFL